MALLLAPLAIYTAYLGYKASGEGELFSQAITMTETNRRNGDFYRIQGIPDGQFLNPAEYPEIQGAMQWQVDEEERQGDNWVPTRQAFAKNEVEAIALSDLTIKLRGARVVTPVEEVYRDPVQGKRLRLRYRPAQAQEVVAFGVYQSGFLVSGEAVRLHILPLDQEAELVATIARGGYYKASILGAVALILAILAGVASRLVWRRMRRPIAAAS